MQQLLGVIIDLFVAVKQQQHEPGQLLEAVAGYAVLCCLVGRPVQHGRCCLHTQQAGGRVVQLPQATAMLPRSRPAFSGVLQSPVASSCSVFSSILITFL